MSAVITSPAQVVNYAFQKAGRGVRVGSLYDGTDEARVALSIYGQTRDMMLATGEWDFAKREIDGTLLKQAPSNYIVTPWTPANPPLPWTYEYAYPADAVQIRGIKRQPIIPGTNYDPRYHNFSVENDVGFTPPQKVVLCFVPNAVLVYAGQVTNPTEWNVAFVEAVTDELAKVFSDPERMKLLALEAQASKATAEMERG